MLVRFLYTAFFFTMLTFFCGCEKKAPPANTWIVAVSADNPPFTFIETQKKKANLAGFEVDLIEAIGEKLEKKIHIQDMDFGSVLAALQSGHAQMALAQIEKTPERDKNIDFSETYYQAAGLVLSLPSTPMQVPFSWEKKTIGVQLGASYHQYGATLSSEIPSLKIITYNRVGEMVQDLKNKRLNGIFLDKTTADYIAKKENFFSSSLPVKKRGYAVAFPKGSALAAEVNQALEELRVDGTLARLEKKWFGDRQEK